MSLNKTINHRQNIGRPNVCRQNVGRPNVCRQNVFRQNEMVLYNPENNMTLQLLLYFASAKAGATVSNPE